MLFQLQFLFGSRSRRVDGFQIGIQTVYTRMEAPFVKTAVREALVNKVSEVSAHNQTGKANKETESRRFGRSQVGGTL